VENAALETTAGKVLELLKEVAPCATRMAVLVNPAHAAYAQAHGKSRHAECVQQFHAAAAALGVQGQVVPLRDPATELPHVFAALPLEHVEALYVWGEQLFAKHRVDLVEQVTQSRLPAIYGVRSFIEAGGLMSYQADEPAMARRAGNLVGKILQGAKPADLPVEQPMKYHLALNLKTAKALGITIPPHLLMLADEVLQ
jgi:putative ABC transport system substrate-binding protein